MILTLIGMSGVGKSHWAKKLNKQYGFKRYDLDGLIAARMEDKLPKDLNLSPTKRMAVWMGFPGDPGYELRRDEYLQLEDIVTNEVFDEVSCLDRREKVLIDTTGSIIHLPYTTRKKVKDLSPEIIYLESTEVNRKHLLQNFTLDPKPIVWPDGIYQPGSGRTQRESLIASFPRLLEARSRLYEQMRTITIHPENLTGSDTVEEFFAEIYHARKEREFIDGHAIEMNHASRSKER